MVEHAEPAQQHELVGGGVVEDIRVRQVPRAFEPAEGAGVMPGGDAERRVPGVLGLHVQVRVAGVEHVGNLPDADEDRQEEDEEAGEVPAGDAELGECEVNAAHRG